MTSWFKGQVGHTANGRSAWWRLRPWTIVVALLFILFVVFFRQHLPSPRSAGYPGIFLLNLIGSGGFVVPVPGMASLCFGSSLLGLNPLSVGFLAAAAETLGELTGYLAGVSGRGLVERLPLRHRLEPWVQRRGGVVLFVFGVLPNPLFDVVGIAAGGLRYPLGRFLAIVVVGKGIKDVTIAYGCLYGLDSVLRFFQALD